MCLVEIGAWASPAHNSGTRYFMLIL
uniref:Uncharacterized protein n=1 Tax=Anguilla anguilla TaxID=7936 RepID=A0A0E9WJ94_ANGAN